MACLRITCSSKSSFGLGGSPGTEESSMFKMKESRTARDVREAQESHFSAAWFGSRPLCLRELLTYSSQPLHCYRNTDFL